MTINLAIYKDLCKKTLLDGSWDSHKEQVLASDITISLWSISNIRLYLLAL